MRATLSASVFLLGCSTTTPAEEWSPTSTTALAITGPISIASNQITFGNGATITVRPLGPERPDVFVIDPPQNPVLMNGNKLCGEKLPTFLVIARDGNSLYFKVFAHNEPPTASADPLPQPGTCATFNFQQP